MSVLSNLSDSATQDRATDRPTTRFPRLLAGLTGLTILGVIGGLYMALGYAGTDALQGNVQRIFYATVLGGIMYLRTRSARWDHLALAGVEVGFALTLVNLLTGMVWSRPIWNTWWTWDPRLTLEAIMALTYAAYLMLRGGIDNVEMRRRFASVYGILAIITVILVLVIIRVRDDTIHPVVIGGRRVLGGGHARHDSGTDGEHGCLGAAGATHVDLVSCPAPEPVRARDGGQG
jgi:hypothetical protein